MTQTIGQRLKAERETKRLTLEKVFEATRIRIQYLQALEADDLSVMPSPVQARGYLRNYAEYLGFDVEKVLHELHAVSTQSPSDVVIGPADEPPALAAQDHESSEPLSTIEMPVASDPTEPRVFVEDVGASTQPGLEGQEEARPELNVPVKPKPARRKKADSQPKAGAAEPARRRGRKKAESSVASAPEAPVDQQTHVEAIAPPVETIPESEIVGEQIAATESIPETREKELDVQPEETPPVDLSDSLWQSWLNRLGSVLSGRMKRRTLELKEPSVLENEPVVLTEPEPALDVNAQPRSFENSDAIFKEVGRELRTRRELLSLHFDEVERNTHVKAHYLDALERGALDELPSTVQTRGMLSNYATFLDLDVDVLLLRFADALQARHRERNPQKPPRKPGQPIIANMPPVRTFIAGDMIFGVGMAILLVGFAIWGVSRVMAIQSQREVNVNPTAPSISDVLLASPDPSSFTATPTFLPVEAFPGEPTVTVEIPTQNVNAPVQLNLIALERTYMRVLVDGEVAFDGRVVPGNAYPFEAEDQVEVLVGSGAAIRTVYNGRDLGLMGTFGQVVNTIYSGTEIITPTALPSLTPTITLTPTTTVSPTATLQFTDTPAPSATVAP